MSFSLKVLTLFPASLVTPTKLPIKNIIPSKKLIKLVCVKVSAIVFFIFSHTAAALLFFLLNSSEREVASAIAPPALSIAVLNPSVRFAAAPTAF